MSQISPELKEMMKQPAGDSNTNHGIKKQPVHNFFFADTLDCIHTLIKFHVVFFAKLMEETLFYSYILAMKVSEESSMRIF